MNGDMAERGKVNRKNDPEGLRERLLDAAFDLFQRQGYRGTSLADVARQAQSTLGALHHHFANKEALGVAVIERRAGPEMDSAWTEPLAAGANLRDHVPKHLNALADAMDAQGFVMGCPIGNLSLELALVEPAFREPLARLFRRWTDAIIAAQPGRPADDASRTATIIVASYSGAMAMAKAEQRGQPLRDCAEALGRLL